MTTSVILVSPGKSNHRIEIHSPTIRALNSFQSKAFPPDESWDDDVYVHMRAGDKGEIICERDRPDSRHAKLKTKVKVQDARFTALEKERARDSEKIEELLRRMSESEKKHEDTEKRREKQTITNIQQLKGTIAVLENTISTMVLVEEYEVVDGTLRSYNDRIFDLRSEPGLTPEEKETLKLNGLTYIRHLLDYKPELEFGDPNATPVDQAFYKAEGLLTEEEWALCYHLQAHRQTLRDPRNTAQHPRPDRSTAERWLTQIAPEHYDTFTNLLDSNPLRMMTWQDDDFSDRWIVVADGEYEGPEAQQMLLAQLRDTLQGMQREEEARVRDKRRHVEP